jgi:hypothetical protein
MADGDKVYKELVGNATTDGMKELGPKRAKEILDALPAKEKGEVTSEVIDRMGRSKPNAQGAAGDMFSMSTYLTNWNKMNPKTKEILFSDPAIRRDMDELANFAEKYKSRSRLMNTSNTAPAAGIINGIAGIGGALSTLLAGGGSTSALLTALAAPVVTAGTAHVTAKMMTSPKFIKWLAKVSRTKGPAEVGRMIGRLITLHDNNPGLRGDIESYVN